MVDSHWPECQIGLVGPVDGEMNQHGACSRLDVLNGLFNNAVGMMLTDPSKTLGLGKLFEVSFVLMAVKDGCVVTLITLWHNSKIATICLECFFSL